MIPILVLLAVSICLTTSESCGNRHFCYTNEIKYGAFKKLDNFYLNVTAVQDIKTQNWTNCTRACIRTEGCQSVNLYNQNSMDHCELLSGNKMSNVTNLVLRNGSSHFYIPVRD